MGNTDFAFEFSPRPAILYAMRNPTPLILTLLLAITAIGLSLRGKPEPEKPTANQSKLAEANTGSEDTAADESSSQAGETEGTASWPMAHSDIPADPKAVFGQLPNGLRYMILPNDEPPNRFSVRLHIAAGSLMETEEQRGVAHFLEHMVFNGTKSYKDANALIGEMRSRGIAFGAHVNAYTSFDETVYMLDVPDLKPDTMDLCFGIMRDFSDGALLSAEEIDAERGVILSEKASRDSVGYRMMQQQFDALLPTSLISKRFPIGVEEVIKTAPREQFVNFYNNYYTPDRMTFVVVGNIDPVKMKERIVKTFGSMESPPEPVADPDLGDIRIPEGIEPHIFSDPELDSTEVSLTLVRPYTTKPDTKANRAAKFPLEIANFIMGRRFERLSKVENSPIAEGSASKYALFNNLELGSISITAADDRWKEAVPALEQEFRRALDFGFTKAELAEAKANLVNQYQEAVKRKDTRRSETLATAIAGSINEGTIYSTPEKDLEIALETLEAISADTVHKEFVKFWEAPGHHLVLSAKGEPQEAGKLLADLYRDSTGKEVAPPTERAAVPFAYTDLGRAGQVAITTEIEDLGITQLTLSNNVRVNLKQTGFEKNRIRLVARIGSGQLSQPKDTPMLDDFATAIHRNGGLGKHSNDELSEILAGKNVSVGLGIDEDAFTLTGSTTPSDQLLQLQLMVATLTDPGYRPEALWQFQKQIPVLFQKLRHTITGPMREMDSWLHGGDFRFGIPSETQLSKYTIDEVKAWLTPELEKGYLELTVVGDFDKQAMITDLLSTFGTLEERALKPAEVTLLARTVEFPATPGEKTFNYDSKIPQAVATAIWKTPGIRGNIPEFRRFNVLSDIFQDRLREEIREKLGASYSPNAGATGSDALDGFGYILGQAIGKPGDIPLLLSTMETIGTGLSKEGASQQELDRALAPTLSQLEKSLRDNSYWLSTVLAKSQAEPLRLELARTRDKDYRSINLEEINSLAKKYLSPGTLLKASILPKE